MKTESTIKPKSYSVEQCGELAEVVLYENTEQQTRENEDGEIEKYFTYDEYRLTVPYREKLSAEIESSREAWLEAAKRGEAAEVKLTPEERIARLTAENEIMGAALEEVINIVMGGV